MTIEERKQRILEITRLIVQHETSIESLKLELDEHLGLMDGRKRRASKKAKTQSEEEEALADVTPSEQTPLNV